MLFFGIFLPSLSFSQCIIPTTEGDTVFPVINRKWTPVPFGAPFGYSLQDIGIRTTISRSAVSGNTLYIGGDFNYVGPNTGTGIIMTNDGSSITSFKKWRVNGPVFTSVPDNNGGYFIGGQFTRIGETVCNNIAHINGEGIPYNWSPQVNDVVSAIALSSDTLIIGGHFSKVNGQTRNGYAMLNSNNGNILPGASIDNFLKSGTKIHAFKLVDSFLYVGAEFNIYNGYGSFFRVNIKNGAGSQFPAMYQMEDVYTVDVSANKKQIYIGGRAGSSISSNGFCINAYSFALIYKIDVGIKTAPDRAAIFDIKTHGKDVFVAGLFDYGNVNGSFDQKGIIVFDTATGQHRNYLNNCDGFAAAVEANNNYVYVSGEFNSIGNQARHNFAIYDTTQHIITSINSLPFSDHINTLSFSGNRMFAGGYFQSAGGVLRSGFAAIDLTTGVVKPWVPNIYADALNDIKVKGDTVYMGGRFGQTGNAYSLGGLVAVNASTGNYYSTGSQASFMGSDCNEILIDGNTLYAAGNGQVLKVNLPSFTKSSSSPSVGFEVKSIQKSGNKIYATGDTRDYNSSKTGYVAVINDNTGLTEKTYSLTGIDWFTGSLLAGNKLFISGLFGSINSIRRTNLVVIDVNNGDVLPIDVTIEGGLYTGSYFKMLDGNVYVYGNFDSVNHFLHKYFAVIDTSVGAVFPNRLRLNNDEPYGYSLDDNYLYHKLWTLDFSGNNLILGGSFRNVDHKMFPSLAKLGMVPGSIPGPVSGITGSDTLTASTTNTYSVANPSPDLRYAWFYTGKNVTIKNNGYSSIQLVAGTLASPGILKVIALTECGHSDTAYLYINVKNNKPSVNASALRIVRKTDTTATIKFTRGNGDRRLIVVKAINTFTSVPKDKTEYNANSSFASGDDIGNSSYTVYKGTGDSVDLKNITPATLYYVTVFEFNGSDSSSNYLVTGNPVISFKTYASRPSIQATNITFTNRTFNSITINCTPGNGEKRLVVVRKDNFVIDKPVSGTSYNASTVFGNGSNIGNLTYVVSNTTVPVTINGLTPGTYYTVSIFEFNGTDSCVNYLLNNVPLNYFYTEFPEPTVQASNIVISNITGSGADINCTPGNGNGRLVVIREETSIIDDPVDKTPYTYNASFGIGSDIGHNTYVIRFLTPTFVLNLRPARTYTVKIFESNGYDTLTNYMIQNAPSATFSTPALAPTVQSSQLTASLITSNSARVYCFAGNGDYALIVIRKDNAITDVPVNGIEYNDSPVFGQGSDLGNGTFVIKKGRQVDITNLLPNTKYYVKTFETNGKGTLSRYLITNAPTINFTTLNGSGPLTPTVSISASSTTLCQGSSITFTATSTNGGTSPSYQWEVNGVNAGTNSSTFTSSTLQNNDQVKVTMTSNAPNVSTPTAVSNVITMSAGTSVTPSVSHTSSANNICEGTAVTFTAIPVNGGTAPAYQWQVNGVNAGTNSNIFSSNTLRNNDQVKVTMTSNAGCLSSPTAVSNVITMTVNSPLLPSVSITASTTNICTGASVTFTATAVNGGISPVFQWQINGVNAGSNSNQFTSSSLKNNDQVKVILTSNANCISSATATSNIVTITVNSTVTPTVTIADSFKNFCNGTNVTFTATATNAGSSAFYQWQVNGINAGSNSSIFTSSILKNNDLIKVILTPSINCSSVSTVTSNTVKISVTQVPVPAIIKSNYILIISNPVPGINYYWQKQATNGSWNDLIPLTTTFSYIPGTDGTYRVRAELQSCNEYSNALAYNTGTTEVGHLYPNPANDYLNIDSLDLSNSFTTLDIVNSHGSYVIRDLNIANKTSVKIFIGMLQPGLYLVILNQKNQLPVIRRFMKS